MDSSQFADESFGTNDGLNTLTYDGEGRAVTASGGLGSGTYTYDGNGLRVKKVAGGTPTVYIFSGSKVIAEYVNGAAPSSPTAEYVYAGGALLAKINSSGTFYYHQDHLSNRLITNSTGGVYSNLGHFPFGESWYASTFDKLNFTTYQYDSESGNHYAMARYHVSRLGRLSSPDPIAGDSHTPQSLNRYAYSTNQPISYFDQFGLCPQGTHAASLAEAQKILSAAMNIVAANATPGPSQYTESLPQPTGNQSILDDHGQLRSMDCSHFVNLAINQAGYSVPYATTSQILNQQGPGRYFQPNTTSVSTGNVALISFPGNPPFGHSMFVSSVAPLGLLGSQSHTGPASVPNPHFPANAAAKEMWNANVYSICIPDSKSNGNGGGGGGGGSGGGDPFGNPFGGVDSGGGSGDPGGHWTQVCVTFGGSTSCGWKWIWNTK